MKGPCAKTHVVATIITNDGRRFIGTNECDNAQSICPRLPGEDYAKCKSICRQHGHAEIEALHEMHAKCDAVPEYGVCYIEGHNHFCGVCAEALFTDGISRVIIGAPPAP